VQVQNSLSALQNGLVNFVNVPNVQEAIQNNPAVQQQLLMLGTQIKGLARGTVPSDFVITRLTGDLLVMLVPRFQLTQERQLVLSMLINQAVNASAFTPAQVETTSGNALITLESAGIPLSQAHLIGCDLHSIMAEVQAGGSGG
jgi:hypothetical protein